MRIGGVYTAQQAEEFRTWMRRVEALKAKVYLEIGALNGGTLQLVAPMLQPEATIIVIDIAQRDTLNRVVSKLVEDGFHVHFLIGDSTEPEMDGRVREALDGRWIDAAFIDGDHAFASVLSDYRLCLKWMKLGGLIGFHDIATAGPENTRRSWEYIKGLHPQQNWEYVAKLPRKRPAAGSMGRGIGVAEI